MKNALTPEQLELIKMYEFFIQNRSGMNKNENKWFEILTEEANFKDLYNLWMSPKQRKTWQNIYEQVYKKVHSKDVES